MKRPSTPETIVFSFIGLKTVEYLVQSDQLKEIKIMGNYAVVPLGEIVVVGGLHSALSYGSRRWWWGAKRCFRN